jgi:DNA polymerase
MRDVAGRGGAGAHTDTALVDALRYLRELGWDEVYRRGDVPATVRHAAPSLEASVAPAPGSAVGAPAVGDTAGGAAAERAAALARLAALARGCERCDLARGRTQVVFGSGNPDADLMIIGEGPGAHEDRQGLPFVGPAGELLTKILLAIERQREQVYIANIVKCRPPQNRDPLPAEVAACRAFLDQQITLVRPRVIVALGRVAAQTLLGNDLSVGRLRGEWHQVMGVPVRVTYHPAALLRDPALKRPTWDDMKIVRERLRETATA